MALKIPLHLSGIPPLLSKRIALERTTYRYKKDLPWPTQGATQVSCREGGGREYPRNFCRPVPLLRRSLPGAITASEHPELATTSVTRELPAKLSLAFCATKATTLLYFPM